MRPPASLLGRLAGYRLAPDLPLLSSRLGERRSRAKGAGLEFVGHRRYRAGDDLRHLDVRAFARTGDPLVREFGEDRQLEVAILVDTSRSMELGTPSKRHVAAMLAGLLAYAGLVAGDRVAVGLGAGQGVRWAEAVQRVSFADRLFAWIDQSVGADSAFPAQVAAALPRLRGSGLVILISDWWIDDLAASLRRLGDLRGRVYGLHLTTPEEEDPSGLGHGPLKLDDAETGESLDIEIDAASLEGYQMLLQTYRHDLQTAFERLGGRYVALRTEASPDALFRELVAAGVVGTAGSARLR